MSRTTRVSFSADPPSVNVRLPKTWRELSQRELLDVYNIICMCMPSGQGETYFSLFRYFGHAKIIGREHDIFLLRFTCRQGKKRRRILCRLTPIQLAELLEPLSFILDPGSEPVRLDNWHGAQAVDAQLHGVSFGTYLQIENLYQGYITNHNNTDAFFSMARLLYPGVKKKFITDVFVFSVLQWLVQIKQLFARMWPNFFKPATGQVDAPSMLEVMNNEIRALTGGDITKEEVIFEADCWRALTELDFKAKEAEELNRQISKTN